MDTVFYLSPRILFQTGRLTVREVPDSHIDPSALPGMTQVATRLTSSTYVLPTSTSWPSLEILKEHGRE